MTVDVTKLFNEVIQEITGNVRRMMEQLWMNWSHLGVDDNIKVQYITKLIEIEKDLHKDVILEVEQKLKIMQEKIDKLKEETENLSKCLSVDISICDYKEDIMLHEYKRQLEEQISGYREQVERRRMQMDRLLEWQRDLVDKLGVTIQELDEMPLPTEEELNQLKNHLEILQCERDKRTEIFLNNQMEIKDIMEKLQIKPQNRFEHVVTTSLSVDFKVTDLNMERLAKLKQDLQDKYEETNNRVLELRERLSRLWECLNEDQIYCENFLQAHPGCHPVTENAIREEIKRCEQIKKEKIQVFIANVRTKIKLIWDKLMYSNQEREEFIHYYNDIFSEDTLSLHENYLEKLTKLYNEHKDIFDLVSTRRSLWTKMVELEARATEPGRYHNRGGQLLKEEKERRAITSNLPKIEKQIQGLVTKYEAKTGTTFTVEGKPLLQLMKDEWENRKAERHNKVTSARKQALTPHSQQLLRSLATSPLGKRNRNTPISDARLPSKRQLLICSANKAVSSETNNLSAIKRSTVSTIKRRISGRVAARAVAEANGAIVKRKLDYTDEANKTPKIKCNILKHKRKSHGKRRSGGRRSLSTTCSTATDDEPQKNGVHIETTLLTDYSHFKENINEKQSSRSTMTNMNLEFNTLTVLHAKKDIING